MKIYRYFRLGDIVQNKEIWGNKLFVIHGFGGNNYLPELYVHPIGKERTVENSCNFDARITKLFFFEKRPLKKLDNKLLLKLIKNGNEDAKREFVIRNRKKIKNYV